MAVTQQLEGLQRQLQRERKEIGRDTRFMMLDYVEYLLSTCAQIPPIPLDEKRRVERIRDLRRNLLRSLGLSSFPERTPLQARCVGDAQREGYRVEKIIFQPRTGFDVPAHLYLPDDVSSPLPGILYISGHFVEDGIMYPDSQRCCTALAKLGFAVFAYEAMGQGERGSTWEEFRREYLPALKKSVRLRAFLEQLEDEADGRKWLAWAWHCLQGEHGQLPPLLVGLSQEGLMVWESIRALDYMVSRPEIDATRLGVIGASGGGQNAYYTAAVDERVQAVVSVCYLPSIAMQIRLSRGTNWWGGGDLCDQVPSHLTYAEFADIGALILPRPLLFVVGRQDEGFPIETARAEYRRLASFYDVLAPGRLRLTEIDGPHGISKPMREAAYGWFARWLQERGDGSVIPEPPTSPEPPNSAEMLCLPAGVSASSRPALIQLTKRLASKYAEGRELSRRNADHAHYARSILGRISDVLGPEPKGDLRVETVRPIILSDVKGELLSLQMGPEVRIFATMIQAVERGDNRPMALIVHDGNWREVWDDGWVEMFTDHGCAVAILDVRGLGPEGLRTSRPPEKIRALEEILLHKDEEGKAFVTDFEITSAYLMMGRTLLGERVWDVRRFVDFLISRPDAPTGIRCLGLGYGGLVAMFAAAMDSRIRGVATWNSPASFHSLIVEDPIYPPSAFLFGVLRHFDLPDVAAAIVPRIAVIANPCDGWGHSLPTEEIAEVYRYTREAYDAARAPERWHILVGPPSETRSEVCARLCAQDRWRRDTLGPSSSAR